MSPTQLDLEELELSPRLKRALLPHLWRWTCIEELEIASDEELLAIKGIGLTLLNEFRWKTGAEFECPLCRAKHRMSR